MNFKTIAALIATILSFAGTTASIASASAPCDQNRSSWSKTCS